MLSWSPTLSEANCEFVLGPARLSLMFKTVATEACALVILLTASVDAVASKAQDIFILNAYEHW